MHLPQSLQLHRMNGFARFFHGFLSARLLHSGHTSTAIFPLLFHCFTRALRDNGPTSEPFYPLPILSTVSPRVLNNFPSVLLKFSVAFRFFSIVLCQSPSFFPLFFSSFSPPLQSPQVHLGGRTRGESIPHRHPIATWYITLKNFTCGHLFYHLISRFLAISGRSAPRPP